MRRLIAGSILIPTLCILMAGCSGSGLKQVSGQVTLDGQPLDRGTISFRPADGKGPSAETVIEKGSYTAQVAAGAKQVQIQAFKVVGQKHASDLDPASPMIDDIQPIVYKLPQPLTAKIESNNQKVDFALSTK